MKSFSSQKLSIAALTVFIIAGAILLIGHAQDTNTIQGCYANGNGALRRVDSSSDCNNNETPISWNVQGLQGPQGSQGPQGIPGAQGPTGEPGAGSLRVVDSFNNEVGIYQQGGLAVRHNDTLNMWLHFHVTKNGFIDANTTGLTTLIFTSSNCTGTAYLESDPNSLVQRAVVYGDMVYQPSTTHLTINYGSWRYGPAFPCETSGGMATASQPITYPVSDFGLTPPFRLIR